MAIGRPTTKSAPTSPEFSVNPCLRNSKSLDSRRPVFSRSNATQCVANSALFVSGGVHLTLRLQRDTFIENNLTGHVIVF